MIIDRTRFQPDPKGNGFRGSLQFSGRTAAVSVRSATGDFEPAWGAAEVVLNALRDETGTIELALRDLFSKLSTLDEDTPGGRRKVDRMLGQAVASDVTCIVTNAGASVFLDNPRLAGGHCIELQFIGGKLACATVAG